MLPRRLHAPRQDRAVLAEPSLDQIAALLADNRQLLFSSAFHLLGESLAQARHRTQRTILDLALQYHKRADEPVPSTDGDFFLVAGHQPELFHPGVWIKNFALFGLARRQRAVSINLIVDNDTAKDYSLRLPQVDS